MMNLINGRTLRLPIDAACSGSHAFSVGFISGCLGEKSDDGKAFAPTERNTKAQGAALGKPITENRALKGRDDCALSGLDFFLTRFPGALPRAISFRPFGTR